MINDLKFNFFLIVMIYWMSAHQLLSLQHSDIFNAVHTLKEMQRIAYSGDKIVKDINEVRENHEYCKKLFLELEKLLKNNKDFDKEFHHIGENNYTTIVNFDEIFKSAKSSLELYFINQLKPFLSIKKDISSSIGFNYYNSFKLFLDDIDEETRGALRHSDIYKIFYAIANNNIHQARMLRKKFLMIEKILTDITDIKKVSIVDLPKKFFKNNSSINVASLKYIQMWTTLSHALEKKSSNTEKEEILLGSDKIIGILKTNNTEYIKIIDNAVKELKAYEKNYSLDTEVLKNFPLNLPIELAVDDFIWLQKTLKASIENSETMITKKNQKRARRKSKKRTSSLGMSDENEPLSDSEDEKEIFKEVISHSSVSDNGFLALHRLPEFFVIKKEESPFFTDYKKKFTNHKDVLEKNWGSSFFDVCSSWIYNLKVRQSDQGNIFYIDDPFTKNVTMIFKTVFSKGKDTSENTLSPDIFISARVKDKMLDSCINCTKCDKDHGIDPFTLALIQCFQNNVIDHKGKMGYYKTSVALAHRNGKDGVIQVGVDKKNHVAHLLFKAFPKDPQKAKEIAQFYSGNSVTPPNFLLNYED